MFRADPFLNSIAFVISEGYYRKVFEHISCFNHCIFTEYNCIFTSEINTFTVSKLMLKNQSVLTSRIYPNALSRFLEFNNSIIV